MAAPLHEKSDQVLDGEENDFDFHKLVKSHGGDVHNGTRMENAMAFSRIIRGMVEKMSKSDEKRASGVDFAKIIEQTDRIYEQAKKADEIDP